MVGDKRGCMTMDGKMVIEPQFEGAFMFSEGLAAVQIDGKWGYIDKKWTFAIKPQFEGRYAWEFNDGLAVIQTGGKHGAIDKKGNVLFTAEYHINTAFHDGLAFAVAEGSMGVINTKGEFIWHAKP